MRRETSISRHVAFVVLVATSLATQYRLGGLGLSELAGLVLLAMEAERLASRTSGYLSISLSLVPLGYAVGWMFNLYFGLSQFSAGRDLFALIYAMAAGLAAVSYLGRLERPFATLSVALSLALFIQLVPIVLSFLGIDGPWWMGEDDEPGLPFLTRYTGLSTNPNQLGVLVCSFPFVAFQGWREAERSSTRRIIGFGLAACLAVAVLIASNTVFATYMVTGTMAALLSWNRFSAGSGRLVPARVALSLTLIVIAAGALFAYADASIEKTGDRDANGRFQRWTTAVDGITQSWFLGVGPGGQSGEVLPFEGTEAHNTLLDVALQGGLLSICAYLLVITFLWKRAMRARHLMILCVLTSTLIQQATHYTIRHPLSWLYLLLPLLIVPRPHSVAEGPVWRGPADHCASAPQSIPAEQD